ncbi:MAG TPA: GNAT family N-acetyltransferase [Candidatus Baltobacteraceae bacterium]|nr:GNAT family N-acetyltransferase [Candidatus Baltobacteraceae bacterium]
MAVSAINVRKATPGDLENVLPLVHAYRVFYEQQPDSQREREFTQAHLNNGTSTIYIAEVEREPAGFMQLFKTYSTVHLCGTWILEDLFVDPRFRKNGVASALIDRALEHAREDGAGSMFLETALHNFAARALYERAGWAREARFLKYNAPL